MRPSKAAQTIAALCCLLGVAGVLIATDRSADDDAPPAIASTPAAAPTASTASGPATAPAVVPLTIPDPAPAPIAIAIGRIGVAADVVHVGLDESGEIAVPPPEAAGWFRGSAVPGEIGPAVILGHVDSRSGPAIFYRLSGLRPGDLVRVTREDGSIAAFAVTDITRHRRERVPAGIYATTTVPTLRLITCGGPYTIGRGYRDNVIVTAQAVPAG